ncbi:MAG: glutaminyl-peptide cyclotransferase, partial [Microthrixaceae bacterium]
MSLLVGCGNNSDGANSNSGAAGCQASTPTDLVPVVERRIPHDPTSYVQGLLIHDGVLYESTGRYGESQLRVIDSNTGRVDSRVDLPPDVFGEGLAVGEDGDLVQLTWKEGVAYRWPTDLVHEGGKPSGEFHYKGEGWGLT